MTGAAGSLCLVVLLACSDAPPVTAETGAFLVRDSAGVEIVESQAPLWSQGTGWTIDPEPAVQIGVREGDEALQFSSIADVRQFSDGRIAVVERSVPEIRIFSPAGEFIGTVGHPGDGPGEFGFAPNIALVGGDTILAYDFRAVRYSRFLADGTLLDESVPPMDSPARNSAGGRIAPGFMLRDGTMVGSDQTEPVPNDTGGEIYRLPMVVYAVTGLGTGWIDIEHYHQPPSIAEQPGNSATRAGAGSPFAPRGRHAASDDPPRVHVGDSLAWEIRSYAIDGTLVRIVRAAVPRAPIADELLDQARAAVGRAGSPTQARAQALFDRLSFPDSVPGISEVRADASGNLWISRWRFSAEESQAAYEVISREGRWLGTVEMPDDAGELRWIDGANVVTVWRDGFDVPFLRVYRLEKPSA